MERAVRKAVDQRDVETLLVEKAAELVEAIVLQQFARVAGRQPEPDPEWRGGDSRCFSAGANRCTLALTAAQPSAAWMFVQ